MKNRQAQQGIAFLWVIIAGTLLLTGAGIISISRNIKKAQQPKDTTTENVSPPTTLTPTPLPTKEVSQQEKPSPTSSGGPPPGAFDWIKQRNQAAKDINKDIQETINQQTSQYDKNLLKILPPKERAKYDQAIRQAQEALKNVRPYNPSNQINPEAIRQSLERINKQTREQMQKNLETRQQNFQPINSQKVEEYFNQKPPVHPGSYKYRSEQEMEKFEDVTKTD